MFERMAHIRFASPEYLLLLAVVPLVLWVGRRSIAGLGRPRAWMALGARLAVVLALCAALSRAQLVRVRDDMAVAFVLDKSLSIPMDVQEEMLDRIARWQQSQGRKGDDRLALVTFGENTAIDQPFTIEDLDTVTSYAVVEPSHTNIASAIRAATAAMPEAGRRRIVLISDGNENDGAGASEAASAKSAGVKIDCFPVRYGYEEEVMVEKLTAPPEVSPGKTVGLRVLVRAFNETTGTLRLFANGVQIGSNKVDLKPGINAFSMEKVLTEGGVYNFEAVIECEDDTMYQNNSATAFSVVRGPKKVLIIEGKPGDGGVLAKSLAEEKVSAELILPSMIPDAVSILSNYDTVILVNVAAFDLPESTIKLFETAVKEHGLGLIMVGGEDSFGAGGWKGTPVEEAMPVSMDIKDRQVMPTGALVVINHTCEFADGNRWGIEISKAALNTLGRYDQYGLLYYGPMGVEWLINLQPVVNRSAMKAQIEKMSAGDMPDFDSTLRMSHAALSKSNASVKHIVIISDGDPLPPPVVFLQKIAADGITISTVVMNPHNNAGASVMQSIAKVCKGRFYYPRSPKELPQIFIKEARTVRRGLVFEEPFVPKMVIPTVPLTGFADGDFPVLHGYVITTPKPVAEMPLVTNNADPLLAHWQYGLGRSAAFTSDAKPKWAADWVGWGEYRRFWGQLVEWTERKVQQSDFTTSVSIRGNTAKVSIEAIDKAGEYVNFLRFDGTILAPGGKSEHITLDQTAPGHYEGSFKASEVGTYMPLLRYEDAAGDMRTHMVPVTVPFSAEYRALSTNDVLLREISEIADGKVMEGDEDVFRRDFPAAASYTDVWQWVLGAGIILFLADVFVRRVLLDWARVWAAVLDTVSQLPGLGRLRPVPQAAVAYTSRLLTAKKSASAARKFEAQEHVERASVEDMMQEQAVMRAQAAREKKPEAMPLSEVARGAEEQEETFTGRLLKAKRRAQEDRKER